MATLYGAVMTVIDSTGGTPPVGTKAATIRSFNEQVTYATQTTSDTIEIGQLPKGAKFMYGIMTTDTSTGAATISIGSTTSAAKYRAAAAFTTTDTPTFFGKASGQYTTLTADETIIITIAAASLPGSGKLNISLVYAHD